MAAPDQSDVVVARNAVAQRGELLIDALDLDLLLQDVADVRQLLIGGGGGHQKTVLVACGTGIAGAGISRSRRSRATARRTCREAANDTASSDGGVDHGDVISEFRLKNRVEVLGAAHSNQAVGVGQLGEDADFVVVLVLRT